MASYNKKNKVDKEVFWGSKWCGVAPTKETWLWNEKVQVAVRLMREI